MLDDRRDRTNRSTVQPEVTEAYAVIFNGINQLTPGRKEGKKAGNLSFLWFSFRLRGFA